MDNFGRGRGAVMERSGGRCGCGWAPAAAVLVLLGAAALPVLSGCSVLRSGTKDAPLVEFGKGFLGLPAGEALPAEDSRSVPGAAAGAQPGQEARRKTTSPSPISSGKTYKPEGAGAGRTVTKCNGSTCTLSAQAAGAWSAGEGASENGSNTKGLVAWYNFLNR